HTTPKEQPPCPSPPTRSPAPATTSAPPTRSPRTSRPPHPPSRPPDTEPLSPRTAGRTWRAGTTARTTTRGPPPPRERWRPGAHLSPRACRGPYPPRQETPMTTPADELRTAAQTLMDLADTAQEDLDTNDYWKPYAKATAWREDRKSVE